MRPNLRHQCDRSYKENSCIISNDNNNDDYDNDNSSNSNSCNSNSSSSSNRSNNNQNNNNNNNNNNNISQWVGWDHLRVGLLSEGCEKFLNE